MLFRQIFEPKLAHYAYLIGCTGSQEALIIDPQRDIDRYVDAAAEEGLHITAAAETHIHADFLSGCRAFAERGAKVYLSDEGDADWKYQWIDDPEYDVVPLHDGDTFRIGGVELRAMHTPGHTPEHLSFLVTDRGGAADQPIGIATGYFVFVGDLGRPDLLESAAGVAGSQDSSARLLYHSVRRFLNLPDMLQIWPGHGAGSACGKALGSVPQSTMGYERRFNAAIDAAHRGEQTFVDTILTGQKEPPLYFRRMKELNKLGPPCLLGLPRPKRVHRRDVVALGSRDDIIVVDTREDREQFMAQHLPGAVYAPLDRTFSTTVGSLVEDAARPIFLVVPDHRVDEAVRDLVRIGYDRIEGYVTPEDLRRFFDVGVQSASIERIGYVELEARRSLPPYVVLDVRSAAEHARAHMPGSFNIAHTRLAARVDEIPDDRTILVHCASGARAAVASAFLARRRFSVAYVDGDIEARLDKPESVRENVLV